MGIKQGVQPAEFAEMEKVREHPLQRQAKQQGKKIHPASLPAPGRPGRESLAQVWPVEGHSGIGLAPGRDLAVTDDWCRGQRWQAPSQQANSASIASAEGSQGCG